MLSEALRDSSAITHVALVGKDADHRSLHQRYLKPAPVAPKDAVTKEFKATLRTMAVAIGEALAAGSLSPSDNGDLVVANRWARHVVANEDYVVHPGPLLMLEFGDLNLVGPSRKGAWRLATILWRNRAKLSPENRPSANPGAYKEA